MSRKFATAFYHSRQWETVRDAYMREGMGLCESCLRQGRYSRAEIVHHKVHLTPDNIDDPKVTLDFSNLERVCRKCHAIEHPEIYGDKPKPRVGFDEEGNLVKL